MLSIKNLVKIYKPKKADPVKALDNLSIDFAETGLVFLLGKSGSGKSTLLNTIGGLDKFDSGEIIIKGKSSKEFTTTDFDSYRNTFIGFIFQEYNVLEEFTVAKNLALAVELQGKKPDKAEIDNLLAQVDMLQFAKRKPNQLSGGQKQRIAIARALIKNPEIIMADEPTGALDSTTGKQVMETLKKLSKDKLVIIVSHDREFAEEYGDRIIELKDGKIIRDVTKKEIPATHGNGIKIVDDNLIIIPKGQAITTENLRTIENAIKNANDDVIISLDKNANNKMKYVSSINDNGNKESFITTEPQDIKRKEYNKQDLKLIKSRFRNSDAFKMGASSLKHKKGKLFFTILLSLVAFVMFGIVDTFSCFNTAQSAIETLAILEPNVVSVTQVRHGKYQTDLTDEDIVSLQKQTGQNFYPVKANSSYCQIGDAGGSMISADNSRNPMFNLRISGFMALNADIANDLGIELLVGDYPQNNDEVVITKHIFDCYDRAKNASTNSTGYTPSDDYTSIIGKTISINSGYKIVGVINDRTDFSKYDTNDAEKLMGFYQESQTLERYGFSNILFMNDQGFTEAYVSSNSQSYYLKGGNIPDYKSTWADFNELESAIIYKTGFNANSVLGEDQVVISYSMLKMVANSVSAADFLANNNKIQVQFNYENATEYEIVAVTMLGDSWNTNIYFSTDVEITNSSCDYILNDEWGTCYNINRITNLGESSNNDVVYKSGFDGKLQGNQIIINSNQLYNWTTGIPVNEFLAGDTKVKFYYDYDYKYLFDEFEVVGVAMQSNDHEKIWVAPGRIKVGEYSFAVTKAGDGRVIKNLGSAFAALENNGWGYKFEDKSLGFIEIFGEILETLTQPLLYVSIGLAAFSALFLSNFIATSISYKKREIGILRAIGAKSWDVFKIFFFESFLISGITYILAVIGTAISCTLINNGVVGGLGINLALLSFGIRQVLLMLGITFLISVVATFLPVRKIAKKNPVDAINNR